MTEKELPCACCGKTFMAKCERVPKLGNVHTLDKLHTYSEEGWCRKFCSECLKKIEATEWFYHHRKDPTPIDLHGDIRKKIKELQEMLGKRKAIPVLKPTNPINFKLKKDG